MWFAAEILTMQNVGELLHQVLSDLWNVNSQPNSPNTNNKSMLYVLYRVFTTSGDYHSATYLCHILSNYKKTSVLFHNHSKQLYQVIVP